jgi:hypothetical protein
MKKQVTFGHILTILAIIILPLLAWGINTERRFEKVIENSKEILEMTTDIEALENKDEDIINLIHDNQIKVIEGISEVKVLIAKKK